MSFTHVLLITYPAAVQRAVLGGCNPGLREKGLRAAKLDYALLDCEDDAVVPDDKSGPAKHPEASTHWLARVQGRDTVAIRIAAPDVLRQHEREREMKS